MGNLFRAFFFKLRKDIIEHPEEEEEQANEK